MSIILVRSVILYALVIFAVRLMGKRQLGELQPSELVITILVSNIATLPIEDANIPVLVGITPILSLVCFEVIMSWLSLKLPKVRKIVSGSPKIIIRDGRIDSKVMSELRFSVDDLLMALRGSDIFDLSEVQYAVVETTGSVSVLKKAGKDTPVRSDLGINCKEGDPPQLIVSDGRIIYGSLSSVGLSEAAVNKVLSGAGMSLNDVMIMTADSSGSFFIADRDGGKPIVIDGGSKNDKGKDKRGNTDGTGSPEHNVGDMGEEQVRKDNKGGKKRR